MNLNRLHREPTTYERPIYGSSRLGIMNKAVKSPKSAVCSLSSFYLFLTDYYPFGYPISFRTHSIGYRYGFNGQEGDNEIYGDKLNYSFQYRMYDARIGRFWSVDPLRSDYPWNSTYAFAENKLGIGNELEGLELTPFLLPSTTPLLGVSDAILVENSSTIARPIVENVVKTSIPRPTSGPKWSILRYGRQVHGEQESSWIKQGWKTEYWLGRLGGKGNRADGIKIEKLPSGKEIGIVRELKPNTTWGRQAGIEQLNRYMEIAARKFPNIEEWSGRLDLYECNSKIIIGYFYIIQSGDNLSSVAKKLNTTIDKLMKLNNIQDANIIKTGEIIMYDFKININLNVQNENITPQDHTYVRTNTYQIDIKDE